MAGNDELGVAGARWRVLQDVSSNAAQSALCSSALLWWEVARAKKNGCSVWCSRTRRLS